MKNYSFSSSSSIMSSSSSLVSSATINQQREDFLKKVQLQSALQKPSNSSLTSSTSSSSTESTVSTLSTQGSSLSAMSSTSSMITANMMEEFKVPIRKKTNTNTTSSNISSSVLSLKITSKSKFATMTQEDKNNIRREMNDLTKQIYAQFYMENSGNRIQSSSSSAYSSTFSPTFFSKSTSFSTVNGSRASTVNNNNNRISTLASAIEPVVSHFFEFTPQSDIQAFLKTSKGMCTVATEGINQIFLKRLIEFALHKDIVGKKVVYYRESFRFNSVRPIEKQFPDETSIESATSASNFKIAFTNLIDLLNIPLQYYLENIIKSGITFDNLPSEAIGLILSSSYLRSKFSADTRKQIIAVRSNLGGLLHKCVAENKSTNYIVHRMHSLLSRGADPNSIYYFSNNSLKSFGGYRVPLCNTFDPQVAQALINAGANVNIKMPGGRSPLHEVARLARQPHRLNLAVFLINASANLNSVDNDGNFPFMLAASEGAVSFVHLLVHNKLVSAENVDSVDEQGRTALMLAGEEYWDTNKKDRLVEIAKILISTGANVKAKNNWGKDVLSYWSKNQEITQLLISRGAEPKKESRCLVM